jgi:hypothetical protein
MSFSYVRDFEARNCTFSSVTIVENGQVYLSPATEDERSRISGRFEQPEFASLVSLKLSVIHNQSSHFARNKTHKQPCRPASMLFRFSIRYSTDLPAGPPNDCS